MERRKGKMAFNDLIAMKKTTKNPKEGDVFVLQPRKGIFYFGKVIETEVKSIDSFVNGMPLIYIYQYWSYEKMIPQDLDNRKFLIAPAVVNYQPWRKGYFETIGNIKVSQNEKNVEFAFWDMLTHNYVDVSGKEVKNKPLICGIFGLASYGAIGKEVQKAIKCFETNSE